MNFVDNILFYLTKYNTQVYLSIPYFVLVAVTGLFLILRRTSLFGLVLAQVGQFSFVLAITVFFMISGHDSYSIINSGSLNTVIENMYQLDIYILLITLIIILPLVIFLERGAGNRETVLAILLIFFTALVPLFNNFFGGNDVLLKRLYFTEILYSSPEFFFHYLKYIFIGVIILGLFSRHFVLTGFDKVQAKLHGINVGLYNLLFYVACGFNIAISVRVLGIYVTMVALLVPGLLSLFLLNSFLQVFWVTIIFAVVFSYSGFLTSFAFDNLPSEPTIIVFYVAFALFIYVLKISIVHLRTRLSVKKM